MFIELNENELVHCISNAANDDYNNEVVNAIAIEANEYQGFFAYVTTNYGKYHVNQQFIIDSIAIWLEGEHDFDPSCMEIELHYDGDNESFRAEIIL